MQLLDDLILPYFDAVSSREMYPEIVCHRMCDDFRSNDFGCHRMQIGSIVVHGCEFCLQPSHVVIDPRAKAQCELPSNSQSVPSLAKPHRTSLFLRPAVSAADPA
jgi:hypothetical protein